MVCDTPPDPLHCTSSGVNISDFHPDKTNYMSYYGSFEGISPTHLTQGQGVRMRDAILNAAYLQTVRSNQCAVIEGPISCNNSGFIFSIAGHGNPITYHWTAGANLQIVGSPDNATVTVTVINPAIIVSTTLTVTVNGIVKTITFNTASLTTFNSVAFISASSGSICGGGDSKTFVITNLQPNETVQEWSISDTNIAYITPNGYQSTVTATGSGSGNQTVTAKITNNCGQTSTKNKTFYIGAPTFNKFTFGCANRSLCFT